MNDHALQTWGMRKISRYAQDMHKKIPTSTKIDLLIRPYLIVIFGTRKESGKSVKEYCFWNSHSKEPIYKMLLKKLLLHTLRTTALNQGLYIDTWKTTRTRLHEVHEWEQIDNIHLCIYIHTYMTQVLTKSVSEEESTPNFKFIHDKMWKSTGNSYMHYARYVSRPRKDTRVHTQRSEIHTEYTGGEEVSPR